MIRGIHHIHFHVGNALQTSHFYHDQFGFRWHSYRGPQQKQRHCASYLMQQGNVRFLFSTCIVSPSNTLQSVLSEEEQAETRAFYERLALQGDSIQDVAFEVSNVKEVFDRAVARGASIVKKPHRICVRDSDESSGYIEQATIVTPFGRWYHSLIDSSHLPQGTVLPGFVSLEERNFQEGKEGQEQRDALFQFVDHLAIAIEKDQVRHVVQWYGDAFHCERFFNDDEDSETGLTVARDEEVKLNNANNDGKSGGGGLRTMVVCPSHAIGGNHSSTEQDSLDIQQMFKLVFVEPINVGHQRSQIQEFIDYHGGPGIAHIALYTDDIVEAISSTSRRGVRYVEVPQKYFDIWRSEKREAHSLVREDWDQLKQWKIMVDYQKSSLPSNGGKHFKYLLQTFTEPLTDRPTYYMEVITRRKGFSGFGKGNITALFQAIYLMQKERGNAELH